MTIFCSIPHIPNHYGIGEIVTLTLNLTFIDNPKSVIMEIKAPKKYGTDFQKDVISKRQMGRLAKDKILIFCSYYGFCDYTHSAMW